MEEAHKLHESSKTLEAVVAEQLARHSDALAGQAVL